MTTLDHARAQRAHWPQVLENTSIAAFGAHDSGALSRPDSVKVSMGGMGQSASLAARLQSCFQHPAHPTPRENGPGGPSMLLQEPETMTTRKVGTFAAACALKARNTSPAFLRRLAHHLAGRAALRRAELRARAYGVIAADRLSRGGAA